MKAAKIIAFIAFVLNSLFALSSIFTFLKIRSVLQEFVMQKAFPWSIFVIFAFAIASFIYWFHLKNKGKKGETVKFALWVSIALLLIPWLFIFPLVIASIMVPLYDLTGSL